MISLKNTLKAITSKFSALNTLLNDVPHYTLLWTNPNPTSSFSVQTISLDLSKYDAVEVVASYYKDNNRRTSSRIFTKDGTECSLIVNGLPYFLCRELIVKDTGLEFGNGYSYGTYASWSRSVDNNVCIPYKIYGIKFGGGYKALRSLFAKEVAVC